MAQVELSLEMNWWLRNGLPWEDLDFHWCQDERHWYWTLADPMDRLDFDEATAFPSLKPDITVFGPLRRTRRQRGWFQVVRPARSCMNDTPQTLQAQQEVLATAADLPPELFQMILNPTMRMPRVSLDVATCALVCRTWARYAQRMLFEHVHLHTRDAVLRLLSLSEDSNSGTRQYVKSICLTHTLQDTQPFLHLLPDLHRRNTLELAAYSGVKITGPLPMGTRTLRSIHGMLPRSLPRGWSRDIYRVVLTDLHFQSTSDLFHLARELPSLVLFEGIRLTWSDVPLVTPTWVWRTESGLHDSSTELRQCTAFWPAVWLTRLVGVPPDERWNLGNLTMAIQDSVRGWVAAVEYRMQMFKWYMGSYSERDPMIKLNIWFNDWGEWTSPFREIDSTVERRVTGLAFVLFGRGWDLFEQVDWKAVDDAVSSFPYLNPRGLILLFASKEDIWRFQGDGSYDAAYQHLRNVGIERMSRWHISGG